MTETDDKIPWWRRLVRRLRRLLRRSTQRGDFDFIRGFGEFWAWTGAVGTVAFIAGALIF
jgi:hypothetical protein